MILIKIFIMRYNKEMFRNRPRGEIKDPRAPFHRSYRPVVSGLSERDYLNDDDYAQSLILLPKLS